VAQRIADQFGGDVDNLDHTDGVWDITKSSYRNKFSKGLKK
jgi:hypothetical protein